MYGGPILFRRHLLSVEGDLLRTVAALSSLTISEWGTGLGCLLLVMLNRPIDAPDGLGVNQIGKGGGPRVMKNPAQTHDR
jgi:hypothetical protein